MTLELEPIGVVRSPWREKFGIPRQSGLADALESSVELAEHLPPESVRGLEQVSHLWIVAWFHEAVADGWRPTVRPPRLGGSARLGVFATRSPHRPNPIALSLVELVAVEPRRLLFVGGDLLDGTPVLDLKPYLAWAESRPQARCDWAPEAPRPLPVTFTPELDADLDDGVRATIEHSLRWDPRPAHQRDQTGRRYAVALADVDVQFHVDAAGTVCVTAIGPRRDLPEGGSSTSRG